MKPNETIKKQEEQIALLQAELNTYQQRCEQYAQAYEQIQHQLQELMRYRFGKKSERYIDDFENRQASIFDVLPPEERAAFDLPAMVENAQANAIEIVAHQRKKKAKSNSELPRRVEIIPVCETDKQCACGCQKTVIRYESKELLHHQPAVFEIIEQKREVVACPKGCDNAIMTAPAPLHVLPKSKVSEEFLAFLIVSKMDDRQPLYHLEKQLAHRYHLDCSRQTMVRWFIDLVHQLQPIYNSMKDEMIDYDVSSCDATTLQVLKEPGRRPETKSYLYCMRGGPPNKSVILYDDKDQLHKQFIHDGYADFYGYLHVDGDNFFELIGEQNQVHLVNCHAHARRKFEPIAKAAKGHGVAKEALRFYKALYKIEREAKEQQLSPEQRYLLRQQESKPLLVKFKQRLDELWPTVLPQSHLGKAINYCLKLWSGLIRYLEDGRLDIDNNLTEQQMKPFVIARKNFLFATSVDGANALTLHFSLIRTAILHGFDPYQYYTRLLKNIPHCKSADDYEKLLPWNMKSEIIKLINHRCGSWSAC